jgi:hypothetical protein
VPISFLLALIPMFVARSLIGVYQMRLFAEGRFRTHIATFALLAVLLWLVWRNPNPAGDLVQITAAMIVQLLVLINVQHLRDRRDPALPVLIPLRDWIRSLAGEPGPAVAGTVTIPESVTPKQKAAAVAAMRESLNGKGYFAYRSATKLLYYGRSADCAGGRQLHLEIQAKTGGAATRGGCMAAAEPDGRAALECIRDWLPSRDDATGAPSDLDGLRDEFRRLFADGVVFDTETLEGCAAMRNLDPTLLATALPTAVASLEDGADTVPLSGRWLTPLYQGATLRLLFVLPADPDPSSLKTWRATVRAWQLDAVAEDGVRG